jgi:uncharacterized membrane protein
MQRTVSATTSDLPAAPRRSLPAGGARARAAQAVLLLAASFLLPAAVHLAGLPVRQLLPMHWPVILAGLCYGGRAGALVGLAAPALSFLLSGMPYPPMIPPMTVELATYGFLAGFARERMRWNAFAATAVALAGGRLVFVAVAWATGATGEALLPYLTAAMLPGLAAAAVQVLVLPWVARWWVRREGAERAPRKID